MTKEELHKLFEYRNGKLFCKVPIGKRKVGESIGTKSTRGDVVLVVEKKIYKVHRIVYMMHYGFIPPILDHINRDRTDNRIENLRPATLTQNNYNRKIRIGNTSGVKGVHWMKHNKKWMAACSANNIRKYLGLYDSLEEAAEVVRKFREEHHGEFCNHG